MNAYRIMMRRSDRFMMSAVALWCRCVSVWVHVRCGEMKLARSVKWWVCQSENGGCERPFFCVIRSRCGCHRSESHPATILTYLGTICTWEYLDYPYYPFVSLMSFGSMICVSSLRVWLTYQVATICMFIAEVIGAVEYERSFTHCALYWSFCVKSPWVSMTVLSK